MTLTGTDRGTAARNTGSESTWALNPPQNLSAGSLAVLSAAYDNSGASGVDPFNGISDTKGSDWVYSWATTRDPGAANAGLILRTFTAYLYQPLLTSDTINWTFSTTTVSRVAVFQEVTSDSGIPVFKETINNRSASGLGTTIAVNLVEAMPAGSMVIGSMGAEQTTTVTPDSDSTNGNWSTHQTTSVGSGASGMRISSQRKVLTAASAISAFEYNITLTSGDWAAHMTYICEQAFPRRSPMHPILSQ